MEQILGSWENFIKCRDYLSSLPVSVDMDSLLLKKNMIFIFLKFSAKIWYQMCRIQ